MIENNNALVVVENLDIAVVFSEKGMTELLSEIKTKAMSYTIDITSEQGRKNIASLAYKVTRSKTLIDNLGKNVVSDWKKKAKAIDAHRKIARDFLDNLKDKVRQPLTDWEAAEAVIKAEEERIEKAKIETRVSELFALGVNIPFFDVAMLSDDEYAEKFRSAKMAYDAEQLRIAEEETARKAADKRLKDEAERLKKIQEAQEAERKEKLAAQEAKLEEIRLSQEKAAKDIAIQEAAVREREQALEADKKAEQERKDKEAFEKQAAEKARIQAEKDIIEKAKRENKEAREREEAEAAEETRQAELAPDKEKLFSWISSFNQTNNPAPMLKDKAAIRILEKTLAEIENILQIAQEETEVI